MKKIFILIFIIAISNGCTTYMSPYAAANPRHKFETNTRRYERKIRRLDRRETKTIDPLRLSSPRY
jgi:hypothetical protein